MSATATFRAPLTRILARCALALLATMIVPSTALANMPLRPADAAGPFGNERLSNEVTLTRVATPLGAGTIRARPTIASARVGRLQLETEKGFPEVYVLLQSVVGRYSGAIWVQIRLPGRPNGRTGWVRAGVLTEPYLVTTHLVIRTGRSATLSRAGKVVMTVPVGTGAAGTPTPAGRYWVREKFPAGGGTYGPFAIGTSAYSVLSDWPGGGVIGIHGTNQPELIPGRPSHGCIRMKNSDVTRLYRQLPVGTPVQIV